MASSKKESTSVKPAIEVKVNWSDAVAKTSKSVLFSKSSPDEQEPVLSGDALAAALGLDANAGGVGSADGAFGRPLKRRKETERRKPAFTPRDVDGTGFRRAKEPPSKEEWRLHRQQGLRRLKDLHRSARKRVRQRGSSAGGTV